MLKRPDNYLGRFFIRKDSLGLVEYFKIIEIIYEAFTEVFRTYNVTVYDDNVFQIGEQLLHFDEYDDLKDLQEINQQEFYDAVTEFHKQTKQMTLRWANGVKND